ncbi:hypothetical protein [Corynebacterium aquilae]|uniref:Uncharacterized protein n=1 Tax=Corynebacterium aquilae DSM 44791 TaxID=1431546 RepID=A0A1L7CF84_9CORY|nr:hypothetical protein [Corynebacterium aquilae]APT84509.1 hypothetical protein CAQU_04925 [Corynebacterium aquilae DSM 44791]
MAASTDKRNRYNLIVGAPNVKAAGGIQIGEPITNTENYPESASAVVAPELGLVPAGHITEDGVTKTVDRSTEKIKDWNGDTVLVLDSDHSASLKLTFMESANVNVLRTVYGPQNVVISNGGKSIRIAENAEPLANISVMFDIKGGKGARIRVLAPDVQVTNVGDVQWVKAGVVKYEVTLECFPDVDGNKLYQWLDRDNVDPDDFTRKLTLPSGASSGTWDLTVDGYTATGLAHNAQGTTVQSKIREAGAKTVEVRGNGPYTITNAVSVAVNTTALKGGSGEAKVERGSADG